MTDIAVRADKLGKQYRLGPREKYKVLRDVIADGLRALVRGQPRARRADRIRIQDRSFWALKDASFDIPEGEAVGIIGRNGAGKSTLLKLLARVTEPTEGRAVLRGRVGSLLEVGTGFHPELNGRENVYMNGAILGMHRKEIDRKFDEIVAFAEVERFVDTPVKFYSSGMQLRLAFSVAAHLEPEILIVDEVLAVGDAAFQRKCMGRMGTVAREGRTVLFVSHNMAAIKKLCRVGYWLEEGRIRLTGPIADVVRTYEQEVLRQTASGATVLEAEGSRLAQYGLEINEVRADVHAGRTTDLVIRVRGTAAQRRARVGIGVRLVTTDGTLVSSLTPLTIGSFLEGIEGPWEATFDIPDILSRLAGGDYLVEVFLSGPSGRGGLRLNNVAVHLPPTDVYDVGSYFSLRAHGLVPLPVNFSYERGWRQLAPEGTD